MCSPIRENLSERACLFSVVVFLFIFISVFGVSNDGKATRWHEHLWWMQTKRYSGCVYVCWIIFHRQLNESSDARGEKWMLATVVALPTDKIEVTGKTVITPIFLKFYPVNIEYFFWRFLVFVEQFFIEVGGEYQQRQEVVSIIRSSLCIGKWKLITLLYSKLHQSQIVERLLLLHPALSD